MPGLKFTRTMPSPATTEVMIGAPGMPGIGRMVTMFEGSEARDSPCVFVAVTTTLYCAPTSRSSIVQVNAVVATHVGPSGMGAALGLAVGPALPAAPEADGEGEADDAEVDALGAADDDA